MTDKVFTNDDNTLSLDEPIIVNCWKCGIPFDIAQAEKCFDHLPEGHWTTKCTYCGACICHKAYKMKQICEKLASNKNVQEQGIGAVMPSVYKQYCGRFYAKKRKGDKISLKA